MEYDEWGVATARSGIVHRDGMSRAEARLWVQEWEQNGGRAGAFYCIRRRVTKSDWEEVPGANGLAAPVVGPGHDKAYNDGQEENR